MSTWQPIATAPRDGTRIQGRERYVHHVGRYRPVYRWRVRVTSWSKTSHVPLYGWCRGRVEDWDLWNPTEWSPLKP